MGVGRLAGPFSDPPPLEVFWICPWHGMTFDLALNRKHCGEQFGQQSRYAVPKAGKSINLFHYFEV